MVDKFSVIFFFFFRYKAVSGRRKQFWAVSFDLNKIFFLYPFLGKDVTDQDPDPYHFGQPDPGSKKSAKIVEMFHKN